MCGPRSGPVGYPTSFPPSARPRRLRRCLCIGGSPPSRIPRYSVPVPFHWRMHRRQRTTINLAVQLLRAAVAASPKQWVDTIAVRLALCVLLPHCPERWPLVAFWDGASGGNEVGRFQSTNAALNGIMRQLGRSRAWVEEAPESPLLFEEVARSHLLRRIGPPVLLTLAPGAVSADLPDVVIKHRQIGLPEHCSKILPHRSPIRSLYCSGTFRSVKRFWQSAV